MKMGLYRFMIIRGLFIVIIACLLCFPTYAKSRLSVLGGVNLANPDYAYNSSQVTSAGVTPRPGIMAGIAFEKGLSPKWGLEAGFFGLRKRFDLTATQTGTKVVSGNSYTSYKVPLLLRRRLWSAVSVGAGGYVSRLVSSSKAGTKINDYGIEASIKLSLLTKRRVNWIIEARYSYGLADLATSSLETLKTRDYAVLTGLAFNFGGRGK